MATLGRVASSIAHEINSPLGVITSNKQIYETVWQKLSNDAGSADSTSVMNVFQSTLQNDRVAIGRIEQQVTNLRRFASLDEAEVKRIAIDEIIDTALAVLDNQIASREVEITRITDPRPARRLYRAADLIQVFHGVLEFCLQQVASRETIRINTRRVSTWVDASVSTRTLARRKALTPARPSNHCHHEFRSPAATRRRLFESR